MDPAPTQNALLAEAPLVAGRFRRLALLGEGGMGRVYEVYDEERHRRLALKEMRAATPLSLLLFKNEFRALRDLRHDNLVRLHELFEHKGDWYFTLDVVDGIDFLSWVRPAAWRPLGVAGQTVQSLRPTLGRTEQEALARSEFASLQQPNSKVQRGISVTPSPSAWTDFDDDRLRQSFAQLVAGVSALHRAGKVHRDLKPSNILVETLTGRIVVLDFGLVVDAASQAAVGRNRVGGTVAYMAPEQMMGRAATPASDWYSIGVLLYRVLTGNHPFEVTGDLTSDKIHGRFAPPSSFLAGLPADLEELCVSLLEGEPTRRPSEATILRTLGVELGPDPRPPRSEAIFIGRVDELAVIEATYRRALVGSSATVIIEGESGVGKTALVAEFLARLERPGSARAILLRGRCHERETLRYNAFDRVIDELAWCASSLGLPVAELLGPRAFAALVMLFPALAVNEIGGDGAAARLPSHRADDRDLRKLALEGLVVLLERVSRDRGLIIAVDDAHWADPDSLALLQVLTHALKERRVLLLLTVRNEGNGREGKDRVLAAVGGNVHRVRLGRLPLAEARALLAALSSDDPSIDVANILDEAGGHPMFLDELVRQREAADFAAPPSDLDGALRARVRRLSPEAQRLVEYVAVAGAPITNASLARASHFPPERYDDAMDELQSARLVRFNGARENDCAEPYHDRVREALYDALAADRKTTMHLQLALALEGTNGGSAGVLARHYDAAGDAERTLSRASQAAEAAASAFAFDRAAQFYRMAIRAIGAPSAAVAGPLHEGLARVLQNAGRAREAAEAYAQAASLARGLDRLQLRRRSAEQLLMGGYVHAGREAINADLREVGLPELRPVSFVILFQVLWRVLMLRLRSPSWVGRPESDCDQRAIHRIDILWSASAGMCMVDTVAGMRFALLGLQSATVAGEPFRVARACTTVSTVASALGQASLSLLLCERSEAAATEHASRLAQCYPLVARVVNEFLIHHDLDATIEGSNRFLTAWREEGMGRGFESDFICQFKSWAQAMRGDISLVRQTVAELVQVAAQSDNRFLSVALRVYHVLPQLAADRAEEAALDVEEAIGSWLDPNAFQLPHCWAMISLAELALYLERTSLEDVHCWWRVRRSVFWQVRWVRIRVLDVGGRACLARAVAARTEGDRIVSASWRAAAWWFARSLRGENGAGPRLGEILGACLAAFDGKAERAVILLEALLPRLEARAWYLHAAAVRRQLGRARGDAGAALVREAEAWLSEADVKRPDRLCRALMPGWELPERSARRH